MDKIHYIINDCYFDLTGVKPNESTIKEVKRNIPDEINLIGKHFGFEDTEFRDKLCEWINEQIGRIENV